MRKWVDWLLSLAYCMVLYMTEFWSGDEGNIFPQERTPLLNQFRLCNHFTTLCFAVFSKALGWNDNQSVSVFFWNAKPFSCYQCVAFIKALTKNRTTKRFLDVRWNYHKHPNFSQEGCDGLPNNFESIKCEDGWKFLFNKCTLFYSMSQTFHRHSCVLDAFRVIPLFEWSSSGNFCVFFWDSCRSWNIFFWKFFALCDEMVDNSFLL